MVIPLSLPFFLPLLEGCPFFFLSAFLATYLMVPKLMKLRWPNPLVFLMIYFHRLFRLIPSLICLTLIILGFYAYTGDGPVWKFMADG